jgi:hypothetical protein
MLKEAENKKKSKSNSKIADIYLVAYNLLSGLG